MFNKFYFLTLILVELFKECALTTYNNLKQKHLVACIKFNISHQKPELDILQYLVVINSK